MTLIASQITQMGSYKIKLSTKYILEMCSKSSAIRGMQLTVLKFHLTPVKTVIIRQQMTINSGELVGEGYILMVELNLV